MTRTRSSPAAVMTAALVVAAYGVSRSGVPVSA